ncbi:response regulator transcription factor [Marilutibacter aestuarii]|uniref:Response regulator transcription factor n=1 Tax=Marilutibacter aestuarii TaxID=1706195 RepID=A0A508A2U8_9GAMM|nr:response regulator transcription factor [Lysobacter aestuarii]TQD42218.1 response regulator transcription factor [Lysobacter aestuarii]
MDRLEDEKGAKLAVLLVEDDLDVAAGIGDYLEAHGLAVDFAYDASQARARLLESTFDLLVLDVNLPGEDGMSLCRELKQVQGLRQPAIFLTARGGLADKLRGFEAGALDYMVKPFEPAELLARIRAMGTHARAADGGLILADGYRLDPQRGLLSRDELSLSLHATGLGILARLMRAFPGTVSRQALCEGLWGDEAPGSDPLRTHVYQLRRAMQERFGESPITTVRGLGYRFGGLR